MTILFDMDGVITSEEGYWRAAWCACMDFAARLGHAPSLEWINGANDPWSLPLDKAVIGQAKQRLINTNWDLCHLAALGLALKLRAVDERNAQVLGALDWTGDDFVTPALCFDGLDTEPAALIHHALRAVPEAKGFELMEQLAKLACDGDAFKRQGPVWQWLFRHFQVWFNGTAAAQANEGLQVTADYGSAREGIIMREPLRLDPTVIRTTLETLKAKGCRLGVATGRTSAELLPTLRRHGMIELFDPEAIVTHDQVASAEADLTARGLHVHLSKPHPFPFLRALYPHADAATLMQAPWPAVDPTTVVVGDTAGDMRGGAQIQALTVAVLTGPAGAAAEPSLRDAGARLVIPDMTHLPDVL